VSAGDADGRVTHRVQSEPSHSARGGAMPPKVTVYTNVG